METRASAMETRASASGSRADSSEATQRQVVYVQERERTIKKFHGDEGAECLRAFVEDIKACWSSRSAMSREAKVDQLMSHLGQRARAELRLCTPEEKKDPDALIEILKAQFGETRSLSELLREFAEIRQRPREDILDFSHRLWSSWEAVRRCQERENRQQVDDITLRDHLVDAVEDVGLRRYLSSETERAPTLTFRALRDKARKWDRAEPTVRASAAATMAAAPEGHHQAILDKIDQLMEQMKADRAATTKMEELVTALRNQSVAADRPTAPVRQNRPPVKCYTCGEVGHIARFCSQARANNQGNARGSPQ